MVRFKCVQIVIAFGMLSNPGIVFADAEVTLEQSAPEAGSQESTQVASLVTSMPQFTTAALPMSLTDDPILEFYIADDFRISGEIATAAERYIAVAENYPETPQARAAGRRMLYMMYPLSEAALDEMEQGFPMPESLKSIAAKTIAQQFYFKRALALGEQQSPRALEYFAKSMDMAWGIMQGDWDEAHKGVVLDEYLLAADTLGEGEVERERLSEYAATLEPCFTAWLIRTVIDKQEPPLELLTTYKAKDAVKQYLIRAARATDDEDVKISLYRKARTLSRQVLAELDPSVPRASLASTYLEASEALGEAEYDEAVADLENLLVNEELSIKRWAVRYEIGYFYLTRNRRDSTKIIAGVNHLKTAISEATVDLIDPVINDVSIDEWSRGIIMCTLAHAYIGVGRLDEAEAHYEWVMEYYPIESHPGDSAELGRASVVARRPGADPVEVVNQYIAFVDNNPSGAWATRVFLDAAILRENNDDIQGAIELYKRIVHHYPDNAKLIKQTNPSDVGKAKQRLLKLLP
jgi:tetratricopeptide (TPR) repeat protein